MDESLALRIVDPGDGGEFRGFGPTVTESGRVRAVSSAEGDRSLLSNLVGVAVVNRGRRVEPDAGVAMDVVVVVEELDAERRCIRDRPEPFGKRRAVLQRLELGLGVRVVVRDVRPRVGSCDTEIDEQLRHRLGRRCAAAIGVQRQVALRDAESLLAETIPLVTEALGLSPWDEALAAQWVCACEGWDCFDQFMALDVHQFQEPEN